MFFTIGNTYYVLTNPVDENNFGTVYPVKLIDVSDTGEAKIQFDNGNIAQIDLFCLGTNKRNCIDYVDIEL